MQAVNAPARDLRTARLFSKSLRRCLKMIGAVGLRPFGPYYRHNRTAAVELLH